MPSTTRIKNALVLAAVYFSLGAACTASLAQRIGYSSRIIPSTDDDVSVVRDGEDYYTISVAELFLNRENRILARNNLMIKATVSIGSNAPIVAPIYDKYEADPTGLIGGVSRVLVSNVPYAGEAVSIGITIYRNQASTLIPN